MDNPRRPIEKPKIELAQYKLAKPSIFLRCGICLDYFDDPVGYDCGCLFCARCLDVWNEDNDCCPSCRTPWEGELKAAHKVITDIIRTLEVSCQNACRGCTAPLTRETYMRHVGRCEFRLVECPIPGCQTKVGKLELKQHTSVCPHRLIKCQRLCQLNVKASLADTHDCVEMLKNQVSALQAKLDASSPPKKVRKA